MRLFYATVRHENVADKSLIVHTFPPLDVWHTYCCKPSAKVGTVQNVVILVEAASRSEAKRKANARRIRANVPKGGWESLNIDAIRVEMC